jgi:hypothetical protein
MAVDKVGTPVNVGDTLIVDSFEGIVEGVVADDIVIKGINNGKRMTVHQSLTTNSSAVKPSPEHLKISAAAAHKVEMAHKAETPTHTVETHKVETHKTPEPSAKTTDKK